MKVVIVHGSPRKGNTFAVAEMFKSEMREQAKGNIEFDDVFLPKDMPVFCCGCMNCFTKGEDKCPHAEYTSAILEKLISADAFIFTTPVYVMSLSGAMKSFLDHFAFIFTVHRPREEMFSKKAFIISSTVGAGAKKAIETIRTNLKYWGINKVYDYSFKTFGANWDSLEAKRKDKINKQIKRHAIKFYNDLNSGKRYMPYIDIRAMFWFRRQIMKKYEDETSLDKNYWIKKGWYSGKASPFRK